MEKLTCKNCGEESESNYCPNCGQKRIDRHGFNEIRDYIGDTFELKRGFLKTIIGLILHPATVVKEYIGGNTKSYQNPISLFLTIIALSYLLTIVFERFVNIEDESSELFTYGIVIALIFVYTFLLQIFFPKSGYNYYERLILSTYMVTTFAIFQTVVEIASDFFPEENNFIITINILLLVFCLSQ